MNNIYTFIDSNGPILLLALFMVGRFLMFVWNRLMRHLSISKHGWPPPHCDADGDILQNDTDGNESEAPK